MRVFFKCTFHQVREVCKRNRATTETIQEVNPFIHEQTRHASNRILYKAIFIKEAFFQKKKSPAAQHCLAFGALSSRNESFGHIKALVISATEPSRATLRISDGGAHTPDFTGTTPLYYSDFRKVEMLAMVISKTTPGPADTVESLTRSWTPGRV
jgi:hypothetical protein